MPRKRHRAPKDYARCDCCGALFPTKYACGCDESQLIARVFQVFPGTIEIDEMSLVQRNGSNSSNGNADGPTTATVSREVGIPTRADIPGVR